MRALRARVPWLAVCPWLVAWMALAPAVDAASLGIAPLRLDLGPSQRIATVTVRNDEATPVMIQVRTFAWPRTPATEDLEPTRDLVAVPAITTIAPGGQQVVRVALRGGGTEGVERAFRLIVAEVPQEADGPDAGIRFALAFSLPVFVTPPSAVPDPGWSLVDGARGGTSLRVTNAGTAHLQVRGITVLGDPGGRIGQQAYVLAGREHEWPLPARPSGPISLKVDTDRGEIETTVTRRGS